MTARNYFIIFNDELNLKMEKENIATCVEAGFISKPEALDLLRRMCLIKDNETRLN